MPFLLPNQQHQKSTEGKNKKVDKWNKKGKVKNSKRWGSEWIRGTGVPGPYSDKVTRQSGEKTSTKCTGIE